MSHGINYIHAALDPAFADRATDDLEELVTLTVHTVQNQLRPLDLVRGSRGHLAFGFGIHRCPLGSLHHGPRADCPAEAISIDES